MSQKEREVKKRKGDFQEVSHHLGNFQNCFNRRLGFQPDMNVRLEDPKSEIWGMAIARKVQINMSANTSFTRM